MKNICRDGVSGMAKVTWTFGDGEYRDKLCTDTHQSAITLLLITQMDPELFVHTLISNAVCCSRRFAGLKR